MSEKRAAFLRDMDLARKARGAVDDGTYPNIEEERAKVEERANAEATRDVSDDTPVATGITDAANEDEARRRYIERVAQRRTAFGNQSMDSVLAAEIVAQRKKLEDLEREIARLKAREPLRISSTDAARAFAEALKEFGAVITIEGWAMPNPEGGVTDPWAYIGWGYEYPNNKEERPGGQAVVRARALEIMTARARAYGDRS